MRILAALVLVCFTALVVADGFFCQDGCRQASSPDAADRCDSSGVCMLCAGGCAPPTPVITESPPSVVAPDTQSPLTSILARAIPGADMLTIAGAGHELHPGDRDLMLRAIVRHTTPRRPAA